MSHTTPKEAVMIGKDVRAKTLVISSLSDEPTFEPPIRFKKSGNDKGFQDENLWILKEGETKPTV